MNARAAFSRSEAALEYRPVPTLDGSHAWHWVLLALPHRTCLGTGTAPNRAKAGTQARLKARQVGRRIAEIRIAGGALKEGKLPVAINARDFIMQGPARRKCARCGTWLDAEDYCEDETCPFSDHKQSCGWPGHLQRPDIQDKLCACGGRVRQESVDPKNFIMVQPKGEDTPCGEPCGVCGKPCTLVHRGTGRDSLVTGEHICQTCDYNRFAGMLPENVSELTAYHTEYKQGQDRLRESLGSVTYEETDAAALEKAGVVVDFGDNAWGDCARHGDPYLIKLDGQPVGWFQLTDQNELNVIEVLPAYQKRGIGTEVVRQLYGDQPDAAALTHTPASKAGAALLRRFGINDPEVDPKEFIMGQSPGPDTPCGHPCARCGKPCTLVHRGNLVPGEHICGACAAIRFNQQLIGDLAPVRIGDLHYHGHMESVREELPTDPTKVAAKDFIMQQETPEERLAQIATQGRKSYDCQLFSFKKTWPTAIDQVSVVINLYKNSSPGTVTTWIKLYTLTGGLINAEEDEHCYQDQDECLDRLIPILQQIKASEKPIGKEEVSRLFKPLFNWMYQTSGKI